MSFAVVTDSLAGLPLEEVASRGLVVIPLSYYMNGEEHTCQAPGVRQRGLLPGDEAAGGGQDLYDPAPAVCRILGAAAAV